MDIKQGIRRNFARRAETYDCHAEVQRFMALELLAQTEAAVLQAACILEVGCGTGYLTSELRRINPEAHLVGMDLDAALLARARRRLGPDSRVVWVVADGEAVPGKTFDLIISNSTFQWFIHPETTMSAYFKSLGPGGCLAFSTLVQWFINTVTYFSLCREAFWECQGQVYFMQQIIKIAPRKPPFEWLGDLFVITLKTEEALLQFFERLEVVRHKSFTL